MRKSIVAICLSLTILFGGFLLLPAPALANLPSDVQFDSSGNIIQAGSLRASIQKQNNSFAGKDGANFGQAQDPRLIVAKIINSLLGLLGMGAVSYTVYAGYLIMTAGGNEDQVEKGKNTLKNAVIGLLLILSAYSITRFAVRFATGNRAQQGTHCRVQQDQANPDPLGPGPQGTVFQDCIIE